VSPPLLVLGVARSGTTLLRVILDRSPGIAIPEESRFVPLLARRHRGRVDPDRFRDDLRRIPALRRWGLDPESIVIEPGSSAAAAIAAVFEAYAAMQGKPRWGDKTPMYMRHLSLLERLFPDAQYVHLIRDGRDAAVSFLAMPEGTYTRTWAHPSTPAGFACQWRTEVEAARALGARVGRSRYCEVRYEELVADPERAVRAISDFAELSFERSMLEYAGSVDVSEKPHHQGLREPPTAGRRDWRRELSPADARAFEAIAGDLLADLGYELSGPSLVRRTARASASLRWYRARITAWDAAAALMQRSPLWRSRHAPLTQREGEQ
jgi:hypothetical protein